MSHIIDLKNKDEEKKEEPLSPVVQPEVPLPPEDYPMQPQLVEYETDILYQEWEAPEFVHYEKNKNWYIYFGVGTAAVVVLSLIYVSSLTGFVFGLIGITTMFIISKKPRDITYSVTPLGISAGERHHEFSELDSFWIHYTPEVQEISIKSKKMFSTYIKIPLGDQDPIETRAMISKYLPEKHQEEEISDILLRKMKF